MQRKDRWLSHFNSPVRDLVFRSLGDIGWMKARPKLIGKKKTRTDKINERLQTAGVLRT